MAKGIPLDDYLADKGASLTDAQLDAQLQGDIFGSPTTKPAPKSVPAQQTAKTEPAPKKTKPAAEQDIEALLGDAISRIEEQEDASKQVDYAVKAASHGVKVLTPLLTAATRWVDPEKNPDKLDELIGKVLGRVRTDAATVISAYGLEPSQAPAWLTSQVSGQIMSLLVNALDRNNGAIMEPNNKRYLQPLIDHAHKVEGINDSLYAHPSDPKWQLINALTMATAEVMSEYHAFDYFHEDAADISQQVSQFFKDRVINESLEPLAERFGLDGAEKAYLGVSLIKQAGRVLATAWSDSIVPTIELLKSMNKETRNEAMTRGYPLDVVFERFEAVYQGLEISAESAMRTMSPGREITARKNNDVSLG